MKKRIEKLTKELEEEGGELYQLQQNYDQVTADLEALQGTRAAAVKAMAAGDTTQQSVINKLEKQIAPLQLRLEGLSFLIDEARADVDAAQSRLNNALAEQEAAQATFVKQRMTEEGAAIVNNSEARVARIAAAYLALCKELGAFRIDAIRANQLTGSQQAEDALHAIHGKISAAVSASSLSELREPGYPGGPIPARTLIQLPAGMEGTAVVNAGEVARFLNNQRHAELTAEFQAKK